MKETTVVLLASASIVIIVIGVFLLSRLFGRGTPSIILNKPESLARVIVAEIAMYHGKALDDARSKNAIYRLLKPDIDRSRQLFLKRFPESESVWYAAVVAVFARGDAERLGPDYPYPR